MNQQSDCISMQSLFGNGSHIITLHARNKVLWSKPSRPSDRHDMTMRRRVSPEMILELHAFMTFQHYLSTPMNAKTIQNRTLETINSPLSTAPPFDVSVSVIITAMTTFLALK